MKENSRLYHQHPKCFLKTVAKTQFQAEERERKESFNSNFFRHGFAFALYQIEVVHLTYIVRYL